MEETGPSPFDEPPTTELTTNTELSGTPSPISGFVAPEVQGREKSPMPQVFGILAVILSVAGVLLNLLGLLTTQAEIDLAREVGENSTLFVVWSWVEPIIGIIASIVFGYAGLQLYNYKKQSIFIGLGAVAINTASGLMASYVQSQLQETLSGSSELGQIFGGIGVIFTLFCNSCCAMLLVIPLMISPQDLE